MVPSTGAQVVVVTSLSVTAQLRTVVLSATLALAVSPVLASWSAAYAAGRVADWWRPVKVTLGRMSLVASVSLALGALAGFGRPWPAWWLFAVGGTVLVVVDAQRNVLPTRLVYPLALLEAGALAVASVADHDAEALIRAALAALIIGCSWFALAVAAGGGVGLGDVRLASLAAGLLGWLGWTALMRAQIVAVLLIAVSAAVVAIARPKLRGRKMPIPLGPALVFSSLIVCWV